MSKNGASNGSGGGRSERFSPGTGPRSLHERIMAHSDDDDAATEIFQLDAAALEAFEEPETLDVEALSDPDEGPAFVVLIDGSAPRWFVADTADLTIGRGQEADILVGHQTVSRKHASIAVIPDEGVVIEDLESDNGTFVNGERVERALLAPGDKLQLGTLELVYVGDNGAERRHNGTPVTELERYERTAASARQEATFAMSVTLMKRMKAVRELLSLARLLREDTGVEWVLGSRSFHFGKKNADVAVGGWFVSRELATLTWTGRKHRLRRVGKWGKVLINGKAVIMQDLEAGDTVQIGSTRLQYKVD